MVEDLTNRMSFRRRSSKSVPLKSTVNSDGDLTTPEVADKCNPRLGYNKRVQINIRESQELKHVVDHLMKKSQIGNLLGTSSWKEQFKEAITVSADDSNDEDSSSLNTYLMRRPSVGTYAMHYLGLFWKVLFAFIPPTELCGGWLCFSVCILVIGFLTAIIGDVASGFGCNVGLTDSVTAITFVALGTSLPDTFASKVAALQDSTADSSVGNVMGSNAVNVYLGLGISWSIAAVYHHIKGNTFKVESGSLGFSVTLFCIMGILAIFVMLYRRKPSIGGELGGPKKAKYATAFLFFGLWFLYILLASLENYCHIPGF